VKTINGLNSKLQHFDESAPEVMTASLPTFKKMFLNLLGGGQPKDGDEAIEMFALGLKIRANQEDEILLEDRELNLLKTKCLANPAGWMAHFLAQAILKLKDAENTNSIRGV